MINEIKSKVGQSEILRDLRLFSRWQPTVICALDIETHGVNKQVGDSPYYEHHGVAGIALSNMNGDAVYLVVNDGRNYSGIPVKQAIEAINLRLRETKILVVHNCKFDLGFLLHRGLDLTDIRIIDTWMLSSIKCQGRYSSNKLKEIVRDKLGVNTGSEEDKNKFMEENKTQDYGDVPIEIMGKYACDDVRYSLLALFMQQESLSAYEWSCHDLYVNNTLALIRAERRGICLDIPKLRKSMESLNSLFLDGEIQLKQLLGSAKVDFNNQQEMLKYLHEKNLYGPPRDSYGETKYILDEEVLKAFKHPLAAAYLDYIRRLNFRTCFSAKQGEMMPYIFSREDGSGFHASHLVSIFSKGGMPFVKKPDFTDRVKLTNEVRSLFVPRDKHSFLAIKAVDLPVFLLAFYCKNQDLSLVLRSSNGKCSSTMFLEHMSSRLSLDNNIISFLWRQQLEGSGVALLERRINSLENQTKMNKKSLFILTDKFQGAIAGYSEMCKDLQDKLSKDGFMQDRLGRVIRPEQRQHYKAHTLLINSSWGSVTSYYLNLFTQAAYENHAHLLLAHKDEFIFEVPDNNQEFYNAILQITGRKNFDPLPLWSVKANLSRWESEFVNSQNFALERL